jgi:hypothetical protein
MGPGAPGDPAAGPGAGGAVDAAVLECSIPCPEVVIEINNSLDAKSDLVQLHSEHPPSRPTVNCRIRAATLPPNPGTIVLTNPDERLRFGAGDKTATVTVPNDGSWVPFQISGEKGSNAIGDAVIEAHCNTADGPLQGKKSLTVFWFDSPKIELTPGGPYVLSGGSYTCTAAPAISHKGEVTIKPAGVDCSAPQIKDLRVGIMQTGLAGIFGRITWGNPTIRFSAGVAAGTEVMAVQQMRLTMNQPVTVNDSDAASAPLYDRGGIKPPTGCAGGGPALMNDTPSNPAPATYLMDAKDAAGNKVGELEYALISATVEGSFISYVAVWNQATNDIVALRQRGWNVNVDSSAAGPQKPTADAADATVAADPLTGAPFANDVCNDPANSTTAPVAAAGNMKFVKL